MVGFSIVGRAQTAGLVKIVTHDLRQFGLGPRRQVDDTPYGGGAGMVLRADVVGPAIQKIAAVARPKPTVILLTPQGKRFTQAVAEELAQQRRLLLVAGHYEGFDERIRDYTDLELSLGDFVLTGGELPAAAVVDTVVRLLPGVLDADTTSEESHTLKNEAGGRLLEYPHYTKPESFNGRRVPEVLLSGHHAVIARWRREQAAERTLKRSAKRRPDRPQRRV